MIELDGIVQRFGDKTVLHGVDLHVAEGESVAVIGESGSGKTTIGSILLRLLSPTAGTYRFAGEDALRPRGRELRYWRRNAQAVLQDPWQALNPRLRIGRLVTEPVQVAEGLSRKRCEARAAELLDDVGLPGDVARRFPRELSGGQRQRVAIARAISTRPRLLVLDEPVSALDVSLRAQILNLLRRLVRDSGTTVVYITHDLATVSYLCSRAYVLYQGTVMEELSTSQLAAAPDNPYTNRLASSVLRLGQDRTVSGRPMSRRTPPGAGCPFAVRCEYAEAVCSTQMPELAVISGRDDDWRSRCHFAGTLRKEPVSGDRIAG